MFHITKMCYIVERKFIIVHNYTISKFTCTCTCMCAMKTVERSVYYCLFVIVHVQCKSVL